MTITEEHMFMWLAGHIRFTASDSRYITKGRHSRG